MFFYRALINNSYNYAAPIYLLTEVIDVSTSILPEYKSEFEKKVDADNSGDYDHDELVKFMQEL